MLAYVFTTVACVFAEVAHRDDLPQQDGGVPTYNQYPPRALEPTTGERPCPSHHMPQLFGDLFLPSDSQIQGPGKWTML